MTPPDHDPAPDADRDQEHTHRLHDLTHEVELLISGAVLFGLLQLPGRLDLWFDALSPRLGEGFWMVTFVGWYYTKLIVFTLILSFGLHLVGRAYWVGLIGLDSVFPEGVDWDQIRYGRIAKGVYQKDLRTLPTLARRADRFCSSIFSFAFWIVLIFAFSVVLSAAVGVVAFVGSRLTGEAVTPGQLWFALMMALGLLPMSAIALDRARGDRLDPDSALGRAVAGVVRGSHLVMAGRLFLPVQFVLFSRVPKRVIWTLYVGVLGSLMVIFMALEVARSGTFLFSPSELIPSRPGVRSVDTRYFADTRDARAGSVPFIQSEIVEGPYVRLELPLVLRRDAGRARTACPDVPALGAGGVVRSRSSAPPPDPVAMAQVLACMGSLWTVSLDGVALEALAWDFLSEPGSGVRALVAYIPTAGLAPGAHVLEIAEVPPPRADDGAPRADDEETRVRRHFIRFRI